MQTQKPEIRNAILRTAKELFYTRGFEKTTMREVSDGIPMSVSNLYKYFKNKEDLFYVLVNDYATHFLQGMKQELNHPDTEEQNPHRIENMVNGFSRAIHSDHQTFYILMEQASGSPFQNFKNACAQELIQHTLKALNQPMNSSVPLLVPILVSNLLTAVSQIAFRWGPSEPIKPLLLSLIRYHISGILAMA